MSTALLVAGGIVLFGALVQGAVGFGMNLVAAPVLALIDHTLVPVPLLIVAAGHSLLAVARERQDADWRGVRWAIAGRVPGTVFGVWAVAALPQRPFLAVVGVAVLLCLLLSVSTWHPRPTRGPLLVAGMASGILGTSASIGGPPVALLYQHSPGPTIRSTMAACLAIGTSLSLVGLGIGGQVHLGDLRAAAVLAPFLIVGFLLSGPLRKRLDAGPIRYAVLAVSAISSVALIVRSVVG